MSLSTTVGLVCLIGLIIIFIIKLMNVLNHRKYYKSDLALIGIFLSLIFWICYMASMSASLNAVDVVTTTTESITLLSGEFYILQIFYWLVVFFFIINCFIGLIEIFMSVEGMVKEYMGEKNERNNFNRAN